MSGAGAAFFPYMRYIDEKEVIFNAWHYGSSLAFGIVSRTSGTFTLGVKKVSDVVYHNTIGGVCYYETDNTYFLTAPYNSYTEAHIYILDASNLEMVKSVSHNLNRAEEIDVIGGKLFLFAQFSSLYAGFV